MSNVEIIARHVAKLPDALQTEVLDFVEFLEAKQRACLEEERQACEQFSLSQAMRGMETEPSPYSSHDIKETYE